MTSAGPNNLPFYLSPQQQQLLLQALSSGEDNKQALHHRLPNSAYTMSSITPEASPENRNMSYNDPPANNYMGGYGIHFDVDSSFDFDLSTLSNPVNDDGTGSAGSDSLEHDNPDKRTLEDVDEENATATGNDAKRRDGTEKIPKKPGRKPLTSEPTSVSFPKPYWVTSNGITNSRFSVWGIVEEKGPEPCCATGVPRTQGEAPEGPRNQGCRAGEEVGQVQHGERQPAQAAPGGHG
jgi:hypothetical protein